MRFAYADPPYFGMAVKFYGEQAAPYDTLDGYRALIERLVADYPDGWALSLTSGNLHDILPLCPKGARIGAWVKPFAAFKPGVNPAYAWEPLIWVGRKKRAKTELTVRDWCSVPAALGGRLFAGAKAEGFCFWLFELLGMRPEDEFHDLFPGSGAVARAWEKWRNQSVLEIGGADNLESAVRLRISRIVGQAGGGEIPKEG